MKIVYAGSGEAGKLCWEIINEETRHIVQKYESWERHKHPADLLVSVHWRRLFTIPVLQKFSIGGINLHNSYLPYNGGADSCSWAIADQTIHGVTLHWIDANFDTGPIFMQRKVLVFKDDTAHTLYRRTLQEEVKLFKEGIPALLLGDKTRTPQGPGGSFHYKEDLDRLRRAVTTRDYKVVKCG